MKNYDCRFSCVLVFLQVSLDVHGIIMIILTSRPEQNCIPIIVPSVMGKREQGTGKLFDRIPANIFTKKTLQEIIAYLTTETNHDREMPIFQTMPVDEARLITEHLMSLQFHYDPKTGKNPRQLLIEP